MNFITAFLANRKNRKVQKLTRKLAIVRNELKERTTKMLPLTIQYEYYSKHGHEIATAIRYDMEELMQQMTKRASEEATLVKKLNNLNCNA